MTDINKDNVVDWLNKHPEIATKCSKKMAGLREANTAGGGAFACDILKEALLYIADQFPKELRIQNKVLWMVHLFKIMGLPPEVTSFIFMEIVIRDHEKTKGDRNASQ